MLEACLHFLLAPRIVSGSVVKAPSPKQEMQVPSLCWEAPLKEKVATHSSILAWEIPWTEKPGGL